MRTSLPRRQEDIAELCVPRMKMEKGLPVACNPLQHSPLPCIAHSVVTSLSQRIPQGESPERMCSDESSALFPMLTADWTYCRGAPTTEVSAACCLEPAVASGNCSVKSSGNFLRCSFECIFFFNVYFCSEDTQSEVD